MPLARRFATPLTAAALLLASASTAGATASITAPAPNSIQPARPTFTWSNDAPADVVTALRVSNVCTHVNERGAIIDQITYLNETSGNDTGYVNIANPLVPAVDLDAGPHCAQLIFQHPNGKPAGESQWDGMFGPIVRFTSAVLIRRATTSASHYTSGKRHYAYGTFRIKSNLTTGKLKLLVKSGSKTVATLSVRASGTWSGYRTEQSANWTYAVKAKYAGKKLTFQPEVLAYGKVFLGTKRTVTA
jgi:hypothetical protein